MALCDELNANLPVNSKLLLSDKSSHCIDISADGSLKKYINDIGATSSVPCNPDLSIECEPLENNVYVKFKMPSPNGSPANKELQKIFYEFENRTKLDGINFKFNVETKQQ